MSPKIPKIPPFPTPYLGAGVLESLTLSKMTESDPKNGKNSWDFVPLDSHSKTCPIPNKSPGLATEFKSLSQDLGLSGIWFSICLGFGCFAVIFCSFWGCFPGILRNLLPSLCAPATGSSSRCCGATEFWGWKPPGKPGEGARGEF